MLCDSSQSEARPWVVSPSGRPAFPESPRQSSRMGCDMFSGCTQPLLSPEQIQCDPLGYGSSPPEPRDRCGRYSTMWFKLTTLNSTNVDVMLRLTNSLPLPSTQCQSHCPQRGTQHQDSRSGKYVSSVWCTATPRKEGMHTDTKMFILFSTAYILFIIHTGYLKCLQQSSHFLHTVPRKSIYPTWDSVKFCYLTTWNINEFSIWF